MQSILQNRRFRLQLQEQISRHGADKVAAPITDRLTILSLSGTADAREMAAVSRHHDTDTAQRDSAQEEKAIENLHPRQNTNAEHSQSTEPPIATANIDRDHTTTPEPKYSLTSHGDEPRRRSSASDGNIHSDSLSSSSSLSTSDTDDDDMARAPTHASTGTTLGTVLTGVDIRTRKTHERGPEGGKVFIVGFQGDGDSLNPHNWSLRRRVGITMLISSIAFIVGFASSVDSAAIPQAAREFGVSEVTESLATGLYLVGFGFGAFFAAPISETVGRTPVYLVTMLLFLIFIMASALSPNIGAQLVFRFLAGFFGSTPLTCAGGSLSDIWNATERTAWFPFFAFQGFFGPVVGPILGGFIAQSSAVSWRWTEWVSLIWGGLIFILVLLFLPETYAPKLLTWKARHLRSITGEERYYSPLEVRNETLMHKLIHNLSRPFIMFALEPIVVLFTLYLTVVYIVLFTFLTGFAYIFQGTYGLGQGLTFLIFIALAVGFLLTMVIVPFVYKSYKAGLRAANEKGVSRLPPERRLIYAMLGGPILPIGLFWLGWTSYRSISIWSPILACVPTGFAILCIFLSTYQYLIDVFEMHAASALVGATFVRYVVAGGMIPVSIPFYENLGVHWTLTILGAISAIMAPVPFLFWIYGAKIRKMSRLATNFEA